MFQRRSPAYTLLSIALDLLATVGALWLAWQARLALPFGRSIPPTYPLPIPVVLITLLIGSGTFFVLSVYDPRRYRLLHELQGVFAASLVALVLLAGALYFSYRDTSRLLVLYFFALNLSALVGWRLAAWLLLRLVRRSPHRRRRVLIIGANALGRQLAASVRDYTADGLEFVGFLDAPDETNADLPLRGAVEDVRQVAVENQVDEVIITLPYQTYDRLSQIVQAVQALPLQIRIAPNYLNLVLYRASVEEFDGIPLINLRDLALTSYQRVVKRAFDLIVGTALLLASLPLMAVLVIAIRLDSPGPVIFRQVRVGENGRLFTMYKFRSMVAGAEEQQSSAVQVDEAGRLAYKIHDDPRVTRVGRFIRRTSLDELPQLFNVLKGEMSLVGPRPEMPWLVEKYEPWQHKRFAIPQGITGWWQINGRSDKPMHLHTADDLYYIQNYSLLLDIVILWRTVFAVIRRRGAF